MYEIELQLLQQLHEYLLTRPMKEVEGLVVQLRAVQPAKEKTEE